MPSWLWADPEHVFWMRVAVAAAPGLWVALACLLGAAFFRWQESSRLLEQSMADLRKLRVEAIAGVIEVWTTHYRASTSTKRVSGRLVRAMHHSARCREPRVHTKRDGLSVPCDTCRGNDMGR